ncbi:unnamed protein product [Prorocentrum cordatum]|uniref:Uncharacterized protein n=1 Tax=Prorocentrum cordatum TaxID=2364126 RepID=A0ABN9URI2_9DINO|nr:unnamed protein product [Polarella glacialis]
MSDVMSVGHESKDLTAYCDICKCELSIARTWYHASGNLDVCKAHFDEIATAKRDWNKYNIVRHIDDLGNEVDAYVRKPVAHIFQTSSAEAKLAALIMNRMSCPTVTVDLVIRCLITAPPQDFFEAALQGEVETSRRMLAWDGALLYAVDLDGELDLKGATGLTHAVASGSAKLVDFLVSARADVMATSELGNTALLVAADTGQVDLVRILLAGSPCGTLAARHRNKFGQTALHWGAVALHNALDVSELLLEAIVADPRSRCHDGLTAAEWAAHPSSGRRGACGRADGPDCELVSGLLRSACEVRARSPTSSRTESRGEVLAQLRLPGALAVPRDSQKAARAENPVLDP